MTCELFLEFILACISILYKGKKYAMMFFTVFYQYFTVSKVPSPLVFSILLTTKQIKPTKV